MILGVLNTANAPTTPSSTASSALNVATTAPSAWAVTGPDPRPARRTAARPVRTGVKPL
jgi:hypothetical protein